MMKSSMMVETTDEIVVLFYMLCRRLWPYHVVMVSKANPQVSVGRKFVFCRKLLITILAKCSLCAESIFSGADGHRMLYSKVSDECGESLKQVLG
jgi:hypothetical protein